MIRNKQEQKRLFNLLINHIEQREDNKLLLSNHETIDTKLYPNAYDTQEYKWVEFINFTLCKFISTLWLELNTRYVYRHWRWSGSIILDNKKPIYYDYHPRRKMPWTKWFICPAYKASDLDTILQYLNINY